MLSRLSMEPPIETHVPQASEGGEEPRPVVERETQLSRGDVRGFLFRCGLAMGRAEAGTERETNVEGVTERLLCPRAAGEARPRSARRARWLRGWPAAPRLSPPPDASRGARSRMAARSAWWASCSLSARRAGPNICPRWRRLHARAGLKVQSLSVEALTMSPRPLHDSSQRRSGTSSGGW